MAGVISADTAWAILLLLFVVMFWGPGAVRLVLLRRWGRNCGRMAQVAARWAEEYRWAGNYTVVYAIVSFSIQSFFDRAPLEPILVFVVVMSSLILFTQRFARVFTRFWAKVFFGVQPEEPQSGLWEPVWPYPLRRMPSSDPCS